MTPQAIAPVHRRIFAVDIKNSTKRTNPGRAWMRENLYVEFRDALRAVGIPPEGLDRLIDRGDGFLALFHPVDDIPMTTLLGKLVPELAERLDRLPPEHSFRLRVALHEGGVLYDQQGCFGEAVDAACRLLDAPAVKRKLQRISAPLVLAITEAVYRSVVLHGYPGIDARTFKRLPNVRVGAREVAAWSQVPRRAARDGVDRPATADDDSATE